MLYNVIRCLFGTLLILTLTACVNTHTQTPNVVKPTLNAFASLPAETFAVGNNSGNNNGKGKPINANNRQGPFTGQPVQGFSGVQFSPNKHGAFLFLADNGFGIKANSADFLLRLYTVIPNFSNNTVKANDFIQLADPSHLITFDIVNEDTNERLLTGADFDPESFVIDTNGEFWVGEEFGPYLLHFDKTGKLLSPPIATPGITNGKLDFTKSVISPDSPVLNNKLPNLKGSRGFEGMAISPDKKTAYPMLEGTVLEGTVKGDPDKSLRIYQFTIADKNFTDFVGFYQLEGNHAIGDFAAINTHQFLVIERDHKQGKQAQFKKVFLIDINQKDPQGFISKRLLVDLLDIDDPQDINNDDKTVFTFPFVTIENIVVLDQHTILVANDNNYPFSKGREGDIDNTEIIKIALPQRLDLE